MTDFSYCFVLSEGKRHMRGKLKGIYLFGKNPRSHNSVILGLGKSSTTTYNSTCNIYECLLTHMRIYTYIYKSYMQNYTDISMCVIYMFYIF